MKLKTYCTRFLLGSYPDTHSFFRCILTPSQTKQVCQAVYQEKESSLRIVSLSKEDAGHFLIRNSLLTLEVHPVEAKLQGRFTMIVMVITIMIFKRNTTTLLEIEHKIIGEEKVVTDET